MNVTMYEQNAHEKCACRNDEVDDRLVTLEIY